MLQDDDEFLVLASDGLWETVPLLDSIRWARRGLVAGKTVPEVAASLANLALKRHTSDNVGVVVLDLKGPEYWQSVKPAKRKGMFGGLFG